jgi:hypothetical protein
VNRVSGSKTVVDIHDSNSWSTGVEHTEECRDSFKVGSVSNGRGNGDQWDPYESTEDTGQGSLHSRDYDESMVFAQCVEMLDGAVKARHTDVVKASGVMTQKLKSYKSFLSDGMIRGSGCTDSDLKGWMFGRFGFAQGQGERPGRGVIFSFWEKTTELAAFDCSHAGCKNGLASGVETTND